MLYSGVGVRVGVLVFMVRLLRRSSCWTVVGAFAYEVLTIQFFGGVTVGLPSWYIRAVPVDKE